MYKNGQSPFKFETETKIWDLFCFLFIFCSSENGRRLRSLLDGVEGDQFVGQFPECVERLWDLLFDGRMESSTRKAAKVVRQRNSVGGHVGHEDEGGIRLAPENHFSVVADEVDLDGRVVESHYHSRLCSQPAHDVRDDGLVNGREGHLVQAERGGHPLSQVLVHVSGEVVEKPNSSAEIWRAASNCRTRIVGREGDELAFVVGELVVAAIWSSTDSGRIVEQNSDRFVRQLVAEAVLVWVVDPFRDEDRDETERGWRGELGNVVDVGRRPIEKPSLDRLDNLEDEPVALSVVVVLRVEHLTELLLESWTNPDAAVRVDSVAAEVVFWKPRRKIRVVECFERQPRRLSCGRWRQMLRAETRGEEGMREKVVGMSRLVKVSSEMRFGMEKHPDERACRWRQPLRDLILVGRDFLVGSTKRFGFWNWIMKVF